MKIQLLFCPFISTQALSKEKHPEKYYQNQIAKELDGKPEAIKPDKSRCDIVTVTHAVEVDFGPKYAEATGQSLNYAMQARKRSGIGLVLRTDKDLKFLIQLNHVIAHEKLSINIIHVRDYLESKNEKFVSRSLPACADIVVFSN